MSPEINAVCTLMIGLVAAGVAGFFILGRRSGARALTPA